MNAKKSDWTLYYNPKCGSCRNALEQLRAAGVEPRVIEYLKMPPALPELQAIAKKLGESWREMIRTKESEYADMKLKDSSSQADVLKAIVRHPILLQRPLVIRDNTALVARPPEKVQELL